MSDENVVSLAAKRQEKKDLPEGEEPKKEESFEDIMKRNQETKERMAKERNSANKSVLRSYRIKN